MTQAVLTAEENAFIEAHLPKTEELDGVAERNGLEQIYEDKDDWIIKPVDSYAAKGVYAGVDYSHKEWKRIVESCRHQKIYCSGVLSAVSDEKISVLDRNLINFSFTAT